MKFLRGEKSDYQRFNSRLMKNYKRQDFKILSFHNVSLRNILFKNIHISI